MNRFFKAALFFESVSGIIFCLLYKFFLAPGLSAQHMDEQTAYPAVCFLAVLILSLILCLIKPTRKFQNGFLIYALLLLLFFCAACLLAGMTSSCPVCNSPYF